MVTKENITFFATTNFRNKQTKFGIKTDDRRRHMYVIGKTGMGKTNMLENMIYTDIINGEGVCYVDPHGDTAEKIINFIPSNRINDVVYFNPADIDYPIAFNVLEAVDPKYKHLVSSGLVGVFKKIWADSWGPRLEYILRNCLLALLDHPDSTLLGVTRILVDKEFRKKVLKNVKDPVVKSFWVNEYTKFNERTLAEVISPIQNKVGQFLSTALIRNIIGQVKSTINMRDIMDNRKILILNLSKGRIGEDASQMLGAMMITKIQLAAMSRVNIAEEERADFYLYVDEFQNFATESFAGILSEARKYHLNLIMAHQYIAQLNEDVANAVFGNVGTMVSFRVGAQDAEELVKEFTPFFTEEDVVNLPKYHIYLKLMIDGVASNPFSAITLPPLAKPENNEDKIIKVSRERYAKRREVVEDKIMRWSGLVEKTEEEKTVKERQKEPVREMRAEAEKKGTIFQKPIIKDKEEQDQFKELRKPVNFLEIMKKESGTKEFVKKQEVYKEKFYKCDECGKEITVKFIPIPGRPLYCKQCLEKVREKAGKQKEIKLREIKPIQVVPAHEEVVKSEQTISLSELSQRAPVSFKRNLPIKAKEPLTVKKDLKKIETKAESSSKKLSNIKPKSQNLTDINPLLKKTARPAKDIKQKNENNVIKPGQVIKF